MLFIAPPIGSDPPVVLSADVEGIVCVPPVSPPPAPPRSEVGSMSVVSASRSGSCVAASLRMRLRFLFFGMSYSFWVALVADAALLVHRRRERHEAIAHGHDSRLGLRKRDGWIGRDR